MVTERAGNADDIVSASYSAAVMPADSGDGFASGLLTGEQVRDLGTHALGA